MTPDTTAVLMLAPPTQGHAADGWHQVFTFTDYGELLALVHDSILAGLLLGLVGGLISMFVMMRDLPFAVHGVSELSFAGASGFLLLGLDVVAGSLIGSLMAAALIGVLGVRARDRNSIIGVLMPFGLGLGVLFLALYKGRAANKFGLLTGQIVAVDAPQLAWLVVTSTVVVVGLVMIWRPLTFASVDPEVAAARGVPVAALSFIFMMLLGLVVAMSVQIIGALLVLSVVVTPGAAALHVAPLPRPGRRAQHGLRLDRNRGRHPARARRQYPHQPLRDHHLVRDLSGLPRLRRLDRLGSRRSPSHRTDHRADLGLEGDDRVIRARSRRVRRSRSRGPTELSTDSISVVARHFAITANMFARVAVRGHSADMTYDVIVIGGGVAGLSAALVLCSSVTGRRLPVATASPMETLSGSAASGVRIGASVDVDLIHDDVRLALGGTDG